MTVTTIHRSLSFCSTTAHSQQELVNKITLAQALGGTLRPAINVTDDGFISYMSFTFSSLAAATDFEKICQLVPVQ